MNLLSLIQKSEFLDSIWYANNCPMDYVSDKRAPVQLSLSWCPFGFLNQRATRKGSRISVQLPQKSQILRLIDFDFHGLSRNPAWFSI